MTMEHEYTSWCKVGEIHDPDTGFRFVVEKEVHRGVGEYTETKVSFFWAHDFKRNYSVETEGQWRITLMVPAIEGTGTKICMRHTMPVCSFTGFAMAMEEMLKFGQEELDRVSESKGFGFDISSKTKITEF